MEKKKKIKIGQGGKGRDRNGVDRKGMDSKEPLYFFPHIVS